MLPIATPALQSSPPTMMPPQPPHSPMSLTTEQSLAPAQEAAAAATDTALPPSERCHAAAGCCQYRTHAWPATPQQRQVCATHAEPGMIDTGRRLCRHPGCNKEFVRDNVAGNVVGGGGGDDGGNSGTGTGTGTGSRPGSELCLQHAAEEGAVAPDPLVGVHVIPSSLLPRNKCQAPGGECKTRPFYGLPGSGNPEFCARHSYDGLVDLRSAYRRRSSRSSGKLTAEAEAAAATAAAAAAASTPTKSRSGGKKTCSHPGCEIRPTYGVKGNTARECCSKHAKPGMVDVATRRCVW